MKINDYITASAAAAALGYKTSRTLCKMAKTGKIQGMIKIGNLWLFPILWVLDEQRKGRPKGAGRPRGLLNKTIK